MVVERELFCQIRHLSKELLLKLLGAMVLTEMHLLLSLMLIFLRSLSDNELEGHLIENSPRNTDVCYTVAKGRVCCHSYCSSSKVNLLKKEDMQERHEENVPEVENSLFS